MSRLRGKMRTGVRRIAAKILGEYPPPRLHHADELLAGLGAAEAAAGEWGPLAASIAAALRGGGSDRFLRLPPIAKTVHPRIRSHSGEYLRHVLASARCSPAFQRALTESPVGQPLVHPYYPLSSPLLVQHGYHLIRLLEATDIDLAALRLVVDFGAGYGSFFRLLRNVGYRDAYVIWDIPVMCALQRFYLRNVFPEGDSLEPPRNLSWLVSGAAPTPAAVRARVAERGPSLFVATWSLSETPLAVRDAVAPMLEDFDYVLCAYQRAFGGIDNTEYFTALARRLPRMRWLHAECPIFHNNFYLIGARAGAR
jgi:hypothetical protein